MRFVIVGCKGYIGTKLMARARESYDVIGTSSKWTDGSMLLKFEEADCFDYSQIYSGDVAVITAGISSPDICRREKGFARLVNVEGTQLFIKRIIDRGARVIFLSSDTVYGERPERVNEYDECRPYGNYAEMKYEVEQVFAGDTQFKAFRLSYVFSKDDKLTKYLRECEAFAKTANIFHPFYRAVVHREDVVEAIVSLAEKWNEISGNVINCGGPEMISRIDFAELLQKRWMKRLQFRQIEPEDEFFLSRPRVVNMQSPLLVSLLGRPAKTLCEAINYEMI